MSINKVFLSGNLTRDPDLRTTASGSAVLGLGLAVNERRKDASGQWVDEPNFFDCTMFGNRAQAVAHMLAKGAKVMIEGHLHYSTWESKDGTGKRSKVEVIVDELELPKRDGGAQPQAPAAYQPPAPAYPAQSYQQTYQQAPAYQPQAPAPGYQQGYQQAPAYQPDMFTGDEIPF